MTDLLIKYRPTNLKDFVGNRVLIKTLVEKVRNFPFHILLIGPSGGGKTLLVDLVFGEFEKEYDVLKINGDETEDMKTLKKLLDNFVNNRTIDSFFSKKKKCSKRNGKGWLQRGHSLKTVSMKLL